MRNFAQGIAFIVLLPIIIPAIIILMVFVLILNLGEFVTRLIEEFK